MHRLLFSLVALLLAAAGLAQPLRFDVVVYGATPAGIAAALNAARNGRSVALIEPYKQIGGLTTGGLSYTDFRTLESVTGTFREYMSRVEQHYRGTYGPDSQQVKDSFYGALAEPHVSQQILDRMVAEQKGIQVFLEHRMEGVQTERASPEGVTIGTLRLRDAAAGRVEVSGQIFIDGTYEGDLAALSGASYRIGRESTVEYGERFAGVIYFQDGRILPGSTGEADRRVQTYNFRLLMTNNPENRVMVPRPDGYDRGMYLGLLEQIRNGRITTIYTEDRSGVLRLQRIPNSKADMNDIKNAPIRLSLPGSNDEYPDGSPEVRQRIIDAHRIYNQGLLYFLQNDPDLPAAIRDQAREWGLAKDEFTANGNFPTRLYIREARRIIGEYVFREQDALMSPGDIRAPLHRDAIAIGDYSLNCHGEQAPGPLHPQVTEGDFGYATQPFQVPYGVILPRRVENLLVPVALSATHVGFSALRLEPTWTALGQAAGLAAHLAIAGKLPLRKVAPARIQELLHEAGASTIYFSDVLPGHPQYRLAQFFGTRGFFHGLAPLEQIRLEPLRKRFGLQYSHAIPHHEARLDAPPEPETIQRWQKLSIEEEICTVPPVSAPTRGAYLEELYRCARVGR